MCHGKFGFSRPDIDGNKLAKGVCLARKVRDREVVPSVVNFSSFEFESASKGLKGFKKLKKLKSSCWR